VQAIATDDSDLRHTPRSNVFLTAVLCRGANSFPVRVRNLSIFGALLEGDSLPSENSAVLLKRGSLCAKGEVAWQSDRHCGVRLDGSIDVAEWVKRAGPAGQQRIDSAIADFRNRCAVAPGLALLSSSSGVDTLGQMSSDLLEICERIAVLPNMSIALAEEVLKIEATALAIKVAAKLVR
jgi:hypothetical protein